MKRLFLWIPLLSLSVICSAQSPISSAILVIEDVTVVDTTGAAPQPHCTVVVRGNRIEEIYHGHYPSLAGAVRINGKGKFLIPGLWDMHVHMVFGTWFPYGKEITLPLFIANGTSPACEIWAGS
jgi:adenine deaminase